MPIDLSGAKWSCAPCVRGHRATNCKHWDRFMVRVKPAGRPLSSCPHTKGKCSCDTEEYIMVKIQINNEWHCCPAPEGYAPGSVLQVPEQSFPPTPPTYVPEPSQAGEHIQQQQQPRLFPDVSGLQGFMPFAPIATQSPEPHSFPQASYNTHGMPNSIAPGVREVLSTFDAGRSLSTDQSAVAGTMRFNTRAGNGSGFHGSGFQGPSHFPSRQGSTDMSHTFSPPDSHQGSSGTFSHPHSRQGSVDTSQTFSPLGQNSAVQYALDPNAYTNMQRPLMLDFNGNLMPQNFSNGITGVEAPSNYVANSWNPANCTCGPGCACLACATHPFNPTTANHVNSLCQIMEEGDEASEVNGIANSVSVETPFHDPNGPQYIDLAFQPSHFGCLPSQSCSNISGTCLCGDNCTCIGCLVHSGHNGEPLILDDDLVNIKGTAMSGAWTATNGRNENTVTETSSCCGHKPSV